ncbi:tRNA (guanosine(37)-N1)-methyltransferase TrmD, partial [Rhodopseudomonas pseudopalustris]
EALTQALRPDLWAATTAKKAPAKGESRKTPKNTTDG